MPIYRGGSLVRAIYRGNTPAQQVWIGGVLVWVRDTVWGEVTASNSAYPIPEYAAFVDVAIVGGGGGGREGDGAFSTAGNGGKAGSWAQGTIDARSLSARTLNVTVGDGGPAGAKGAGNVTGSSRGGATSVNSIAANGGDGGSGTGGSKGGSPGNFTAFGRTFPGGGEANSGSGRQSGQPPGGGGGGGAGGIFNGQTAGMPGAPGTVWLGFRSY